MKEKRILILYTGGTFGMDYRKGPSGKGVVLSVPNLSPENLKKRFHAHVPELQELAHCDVEIILNRDSAHIGMEEWLLQAEAVSKKWKDYDGFVILHGTDTLAYTAAALSFLLRPCKKPVILTGAQLPLSAHRTDARTNLLTSIEIAAEGRGDRFMNQVLVFYGTELLQGNRVRKKSASDFEAFESPHRLPLAIVGTTIRYLEPTVQIQRKTSSVKRLFKKEFSKKVLMLKMTPGFPAESLTDQILEELDAVVLLVFLSGTAPTHDGAFLRFLQRAKRLKLPVVVTTEGSSQLPNRQELPPPYAASGPLFSEGCLWAGNMTPECAYVKTSFLVAQPGGKATFSKMWKMNLADESG